MQDNGRSSAIQRLPAYLLWVFLSAIKFSLVPFRCHFCNRLSQSTVFQTLLRFTQTGCEIQNKYNNLQSLLNKHSVEATDEHRQEFTEEVKTRNKSKTRCEDLRSGNLLAFLLIDSLLGVLLMWWIQHNNWPDIWADWTISSANTTAESLQKLLQWLMGALQALKLNSALAHFLGQFFLYHVYLWIGYLAVMQPVLGWAIWYMSLTGCLGVSVILAVTSDMVSMLTFHIYCFYVYAARLYCLQVTGLLALSRLFRGKKWNVLRKRVDTCNYDVDQLFIGTLLFTILLFLLPTTALFYAVFTGLRLVIIALKGVLTKTTEVLKRVPAYSILLCLTGSDMLLSGVQFDLVDQPGEGCSNALVMEVQHMGMYDTLQLSYQDVTTKKSSHQQQTRNPILALGSDLISGHLIYPWGLKHLQNV